MEIISVIEIKDGVVHNINSYLNRAEAEEEFRVLVEGWVESEEDMEAALDDGYVSVMNASVCITHSFVPDVDDLPAYMKV